MAIQAFSIYLAVLQLYFLQQKDNNVVRFKFVLMARVTLLLLCQNDRKKCLTWFEFKIFSFKFFTAEKKYTENAFPGFVCVTFFHVAVEG